jgi:hypothetical protein
VLNIVSKAKDRGISLRAMGAMAVYLHSNRFRHFFRELNRLFTDVDVVGYSTQSKLIERYFAEMGYRPENQLYELAVSAHGKRSIYSNPDTKIHIDVFFDRLEMCHTIDFRKRLELDYPTITLGDLLLEKMQIVHINKKDLIDTSIMLREHDVGDHDSDMINARYISKLLSDDWGFYYTVTQNLGHVRAFSSTVTEMTAEDKKAVASKVDMLVKRLEIAPKSARWKIRSRIGTSRKWYNDVEEVVR